MCGRHCTHDKPKSEMRISWNCKQVAIYRNKIEMKSQSAKRRTNEYLHSMEINGMAKIIIIVQMVVICELSDFGISKRHCVNKMAKMNFIGIESGGVKLHIHYVYTLSIDFP